MLWEEILRWADSPMRRLLMTAYAGIFIFLLWLVWRIVYLFIYQRFVFTIFMQDLDYVYQATHFIGRGRRFGWAVFRSTRRARLKLILFGRTVFSLPLPAGKRDARRLRARLLLLFNQGPEVSERMGVFMRRLNGRMEIDKFLFRAAVGLGDPSLTGMAASSFYLMTAFLPHEERRYAAVLPMYDRDGLDLEAEVATGFRVYKTLVPAILFFFNPMVLRFAWRWRFPRLPREAA